jgi:uncharacterized protein YkwD
LATVVVTCVSVAISGVFSQDQVVTDVPAGACPLGKDLTSVRCEVNAIREANGRKPLKVNQRLRKAAKAHAVDMLHRGYFDHNGPGGSTPEKRVKASGYVAGSRRWKIGENLAYGTGSASKPGSIVSAWMKSPPHRKNLLERAYREGGGAIVSGTYKGRSATIYVVEFGVRR